MAGRGGSSREVGPLGVLVGIIQGDPMPVACLGVLCLAGARSRQQVDAERLRFSAPQSCGSICPSLQEFGRRRGGRGAPGRGEGRFGSPPPPPLGGIGRGGRGDFSGRDAGPAARGRGGSPYPGGGRGRGGRRSFTPSPQLRQQQQRYSPASSYGRGYSGGGTSPQGVNAGFGAASGKLFGRGAEAVSFDRDKEKGLWKVRSCWTAVLQSCCSWHSS